MLTHVSAERVLGGDPKCSAMGQLRGYEGDPKCSSMDQLRRCWGGPQMLTHGSAGGLLGGTP